MQAKNMQNLRIYDWTKTVEDKINTGSKLFESLPSKFFIIEEKGTFVQKIQGNWDHWELTNEGSGQYPIFKCFIFDGTFQFNINNRNFEYSLKDKWIKICIRIDVDEENKYSLSNKNEHLYIINNSFGLDKESKVLEASLQKMFLGWFKDNLDLITKHVNAHKIKYSISEDLTLAGWDTNYVTSFSNVNKTIIEKGLYPKSFDKDFTDPEFGIGLNINGTFKPWLITTGADGENVNFDCRIGENSFFTNKRNYIPIPFSPDAFVKVQVKLDYFNSEIKTFKDPTGEGVGNEVNLKVNLSSDKKGNPAVIVVDSKLLEKSQGPIIDSCIAAMVKEWFEDYIGEFKNIFSYFLLGEVAKDKNFQWLKPTTAYYGVASVNNEVGEPDLDKSVFSVMAMVENHKNEKPQHTVDARILSTVSNEAAFGIDMPLFVEKWLQTALIAMQIGTEDQFEKTDNGLFIKNKEKIKFGTITNNDGDNVPAYVDSGKFRLGIDNNQIVIDIEDLSWEHARGIDIHVNFRQHYDLSLKSGTDKLGKEFKNVLIPTESSAPTLQISFTLEAWKQKEDLIVDFTTGIGLSIIFGSIPFAGEVLAGIKNAVRAGISEAAEIASQEGLEMTELMWDHSIPNPGLTPSQLEQQTLEFEETSLRASNQIANNTAVEVAEEAGSIGSKIWSTKIKSVIGIVMAAVGGMIPYMAIKIAENLQKQQYSELPTIDNFVANCVGAVNWPDNGEFEVESAKLQGIYLMGGRLKK